MLERLPLFGSWSAGAPILVSPEPLLHLGSPPYPAVRQNDLRLREITILASYLICALPRNPEDRRDFRNAH
jgi:hypothetical protein